MDFELEQSVLPSRLNVNQQPPPPPHPVMHFGKNILSYAIHELKK